MVSILFSHPTHDEALCACIVGNYLEQDRETEVCVRMATGGQDPDAITIPSVFIAYANFADILATMTPHSVAELSEVFDGSSACCVSVSREWPY